MSWAPSAEGLQQLVGLFKASRSADNQQHRAIQQQLVEFNVIPDYNNYLAYILRDPHPDGLDRHSGAVEGAVRQLAGLTLKNNTKEHWNKVQPEVQQYVRSILLDCVGDSEQYIRMVVGSCITTIVYAGGLETWPDLVPTLFSMLSHQDPITVRGALSALNKICEDSPEKLAKDVTTQPLNSLIPKFLEFLGNPDPELRKSALHCLNHFVLLMPPALRQHIDTFLQALFALATDTVGDVRKCVCQALVMLLEVAPEKLQPMMPNIVQYMLQACGDEDETVALEACEFWPAICETKMAQEALGGVLPQLVPVLLKGMVYSEEDMMTLDLDEDDELQPDRPEDIKPRFHRARHVGAALALGAIAEGCVDSILQYLPQLVPWLIATLADQKSLIRSITCWTLSRYSKWVTEQADQSSYLQPMMQELLKRVLDHNKKVQEAACSAFATLEEDAGNLLVPYIGPILQNLIFAFSKYQQKNLLILYDAIGTLADAVGGALNTPEHVGVLLPPLVERWNGITDDDKSLFPLLECFTSIAQALGPGFTTFAQPVFTRCVALIDSTLRHEQQNVDVDKEFIVCSLDMISGMTEGMGAAVAPFVKQTQLPMYLLACMKDAMPDVRQSAYALVGDIAKACIEELAAVLPEYLPLLTEQLDHRTVSVCNNASWAIGELAIKMGPSMQPYVEGVLAKLVPIINKHEEVNKSLVENTAITLGRLGLVCPEVGAPHLEHFIKPWCMALRSIRDDIEKDHAFQGLCRMLRINPRAPLMHMAELFDAFASWTQPPEALATEMKQIIDGYGSSLPPDQWQAFLQTLAPDLRRRLHEKFGL